MPHLEYDDNGHLIPPVGLTMVELELNKNKSNRFEWSNAISNKIKKDVVVFKHSKVRSKNFYNGKRQSIMLWRNKK